MNPSICSLATLAVSLTLLASMATAEEPATVVEVVAHGTGLTKKAALEDAYRNAVQQVVGAYVDAETLVENDELVNDKILATSNGFIVDSKEISSRESNGLVRVTIRAKVESNKLVAGLKRVKITIRDLDGESLFAKALTKMERKENLQETLLKILGELGPMLEAEMIGEPDFDETTSELVFQLKLQPDYDKFLLFRDRLGSFLDKVCIRKTEVGIQATKGSIKHQSLPPEVMKDLYISNTSKDLLWGPVVTTNKEWVLWLQTFENKSFTSLRWTGYVLDTDWHPVVMTALRRMATHRDFYSRKKDNPYHFNFEPSDTDVPTYPEFGRTFVATSFLDADKKLIQFDKFELISDLYGFRGIEVNDYLPLPLLPPALVNYCNRGIGKTLFTNTVGYHGFPQSTNERRAGRWEHVEGYTVNLYIAPVMLALAFEDNPRLVFRRFCMIERRLKVEIEELQGIRSTQFQIEYTPPNLPAMADK
ncbi:MAG TPA: hypothetical protein EYQ14_18100 [Gammaproteobacteria bacterium]|nr:hypothetical protein [Gammaproteobacteria bacterium]